MGAPATLVPPRPPIPPAALSWHGYFRALRTNALAAWPEAAYRQDHCVQRVLGRKIVLLNAPDAIHHVLVDNAANYRRSPASIRILRPITGDGLLLSTGEDWRHQRRTIAPALAPRVMPLLARHIVVAAGAVLDRLPAERPLDLLAALQHLALEIAASSMFSLEAGGFGAEMRALIGQFSSRYAQPHLLDLLLPAAVPTWRDLGRRRFRRRWLALMERVVGPRLLAPPAPVARDLFDLLIAARDPETGAAFTRAQLIDQTATMIVAGHETTALALFWSAYLLARAPAAQDRLAAEARTVDLGADAAMAALPQLAFTRAVVSEAMRLYPPAFAFTRQAIGADRCGDVAVARGDVLMIWPWVLHRHRLLWPDPEAFDPQRFLPGAPAIPRFAYLPFGAGPRICVGAQFALTEATLVLALLVGRFRITLADAAPVLPVAVVTTQPDHSPPFRLQRRD